MTPEQLVAIVTAFAGLVGAFALVLREISALRHDLNGRLQELIDARVDAASQRGELTGRDFVHQLRAATIDTPVGEKVRSIDALEPH